MIELENTADRNIASEGLRDESTVRHTQVVGKVDTGAAKRPSPTVGMGCPDTAADADNHPNNAIGYELRIDLDFDTQRTGNGQDSRYLPRKHAKQRGGASVPNGALGLKQQHADSGDLAEVRVERQHCGTGVNGCRCDPDVVGRQGCALVP